MDHDPIDEEAQEPSPAHGVEPIEAPADELAVGERRVLAPCLRDAVGGGRFGPGELSAEGLLVPL
jgi:hypothetical protein